MSHQDPRMLGNNGMVYAHGMTLALGASSSTQALPMGSMSFPEIQNMRTQYFRDRTWREGMSGFKQTAREAEARRLAMLMLPVTHGASSLGSKLTPEVEQVLASVQQVAKGMVDLLAVYDRDSSSDNQRKVQILEDWAHNQINQLFGYEVARASRELIPVPGAFMAKGSTDENKSKTAAAKQAESTQRSWPSKR